MVYWLPEWFDEKKHYIRFEYTAPRIIISDYELPPTEDNSIHETYVSHLWEKRYKDFKDTAIEELHWTGEAHTISFEWDCWKKANQFEPFLYDIKKQRWSFIPSHYE